MNKLHDIKLHYIIVNTFVKHLKCKDIDTVNYKSVKAIVEYFSNVRNHSPFALVLYRNLIKSYMDKRYMERKFVYNYIISKDDAMLNIFINEYVHTIQYKNGRCLSGETI